MNKILMLSTDLHGQGGVASVVSVYQGSDSITNWPIVFVATHCSGSYLDKIFIFFKSFIFCAKTMFKGEVALVHVHTSSRASFWRKSLFIILALICRVKVVFHLHGSEFWEFYSQECGYVRKEYVRWILKKVDRVIVLSSQWKSLISEICDEDKITVVFNPICPVGDGDFVRSGNDLLFLGRLGNRKGIYTLLEAIALLKNKFPKIVLRCGGDGELEKVKQYAKKLGISKNVLLLGWVSGEDKRQLLMQSTAYVLPSFKEGLPMGILEAMSAGLPVVSTTIGGIPDAIEDGVEGCLVEPGEPAALAEAIRKLMVSPQMRANMGRSGRQKVENFFLPEKVIPQVLVIYKELGVEANI